MISFENICSFITQLFYLKKKKKRFDVSEGICGSANSLELVYVYKEEEDGKATTFYQRGKLVFGGSDFVLFLFLRFFFFFFQIEVQGGSESKEPTCNAGDLGLILGSRRSHGEGNGTLLQYSCLENPMDRGAQRLSPWGCRVGHA